MKQTRWVWVILLAVLMGCSRSQSVSDLPAATIASGRVTFAGSTTVQPLAAEIGQTFNAEYPDVTLDIAAGGSSIGINAIHDGTVDIGMASRKLTDEEATGIEVHQIAVDVIAMVVNTSNPVNDLTTEQIRDIYTGKITNWAEVNGNNAAITVAVRETTSGTRKAFDELVLGDLEPESPNLERLMTAGDVAMAVATDPNAIGYIGFGNFGEGIRPIRVDGIDPNEANALSGQYRLTRPLQLLTGPLTQPMAMEFIDYALGIEGQQVVVDSGWIPAK